MVVAVEGLNLDNIIDIGMRTDATMLGVSANFSNPITFFVPANAAVNIAAISSSSSSSLFQNITFSGVPGAALFSFLGTGEEGTLMLSGSNQTPFVTPFTQLRTYVIEILFQFSQSKGQNLMNGVIGVAPIQAVGMTGNAILLAIQSQDASVNDPNGALALITLGDLNQRTD